MIDSLKTRKFCGTQHLSVETERIAIKGYKKITLQYVVSVKIHFRDEVE